MNSFTPHLIRLPKRSVLAFTTVGSPNKSQPIIQALYGTAYGTKFKVYKPKGKTMAIGCLSAFWPDAHRKPKSKWTGIWNLEIPSFVKQRDLLQKNLKIMVKIGTQPATTYAEILHIGPYAKQKPAVQKLHAFIKEQGLKLAGPHEEVYLSRPGPKAKTMIRYRVAKS